MEEEIVQLQKQGSYEEVVLHITSAISKLNLDRFKCTKSLFQQNCRQVCVLFSNRSFNYFKLGKLDCALADCEAAIKYHHCAEGQDQPPPNQTLLLFSKVLFELGRYRLALETLHRMSFFPNEENLVAFATKLRRKCERELHFESCHDILEVSSDSGEDKDEYWKAGTALTACNESRFLVLSDAEYEINFAEFKKSLSSTAGRYTTICELLIMIYRLYFQAKTLVFEENDETFVLVTLFESLVLTFVNLEPSISRNCFQQLGAKIVPFQSKWHQTTWNSICGKLAQNNFSFCRKHEVFCKATLAVSEHMLANRSVTRAASFFPCQCLAFFSLLPGLCAKAGSCSFPAPAGELRMEELLSFEANVEFVAEAIVVPSKPFLFIQALVEVAKLCCEGRRSSFVSAVLDGVVPPELRSTIRKCVAVHLRVE